MSDVRSITGGIWKLADADPARVSELEQQLGCDPVLARCLVVRGMDEPERARRMLRPRLDALHDPYAMDQMDVAVDRLRKAIADSEPLRVVTDYDVDGTTSSLILQGTLKMLGHDAVSYHIPDRMNEGYGFSVQAAEAAARDGIRLIVTADIGVKDHAAVTRARELGLDVIICDHHLPPGEDVPQDALAVLCPPKKGCSYPNPSLAACGVSLKLAQAMLAGHPNEAAIVRSLMKLAAIGTVADVVDLLTEENRAIVTLGLESLNTGPHTPGLAALLRVAQASLGTITSRTLGFQIGPRINAAGRIANAKAVVELLTTRDPKRALERAQELDALNKERRRMQDRVLEMATEVVGDAEPGFVVVWGHEKDGWHRGVAGIVAARLRDRLNRPAAVIAVTAEGRATGSVRSIPQVHAVQALERASDLLERFGGHPAAAGFSLPADRLPALRERLDAAAWELLGAEPPALIRTVDAVLDVDQVDLGLVHRLAALGPHGKGNPSPRVIVRGGLVESPRLIKDVHLKASVRSGPHRIDTIWWRGAQHRDALAGEGMELYGSLKASSWQGIERVQLEVEDARRGSETP